MDPNVAYSNQQLPTTPNQVTCMQGVPYNKAIDGVLWPAVVLRPDIGYDIGILSQFIQNPGQAHWEVLKLVISYLNTTKDLWLTFGGGSKLLIEGFCDADWVGQKTSIQFRETHSFLAKVSVISWSSKKQHIIALSSMELEYIAQMHATKEALWLRSFINEIQGLHKRIIVINCNNQGAITLAKDNKFHSQTKHIDLNYHFIREAVEDKKITMEYIPMGENITDIFTKALARLKFIGIVRGHPFRPPSPTPTPDVFHPSNTPYIPPHCRRPHNPTPSTSPL